MSPDPNVPDLAAVEALVDFRRTSLLVDPHRAVDRALLQRLCALVFHAPNHKRTWPWRVAVFTGTARAELGQAFAADLVAGSHAAGIEPPTAKVDKTLTKYLRAPAVVVVGAAPGEDPIRHSEDLHAVAAGVENLLLGAAAAGLGSMWSSPPAVDAPAVNELAGFEVGCEMVAVVYLGHPTAHQPLGARAEPAIAWHTGD